MEVTNQPKQNGFRKLGGVIITAVAIIVAGFCVKAGLENFSTAGERVVSVRGVSERTIPADLVTWPLVYKTTADDLEALYDKVSHANKVIVAFLKENGIPEDDITFTTPEVEDLATSEYSSYYSTERKRDRYNSKSVVVVKSSKIDAVRKLMVRTPELMKQGIVLSAEDYSDNVEYEYTGLNSIKPDMIAEATKEARKAAEQFAKDSGSGVGAIKSASQGYFTIEDRDTYSPHIKNVRVVTSVEYFIK